MPAASTYRIEELAPFLQCAIEDTYDTEKALVATDSFATMGLDAKIYEGDDREIVFDGNNGINIPVIKGNPYNGFDFEFYAAGSGTAGTAPIAEKIFRICGADGTTTALTSNVYVAGDLNGMDSGTFKMFEKISDAKYLEYLTTGARGQLAYSFADGDKGKFKVSNMLGTYYEPSVLNTAVSSDFGTQQTDLPQDIDFANTGELSFGGHQLCVQSMDIDNVFGFDISRLNLPGCSSTSAKKVVTTINLTFRMPDWELSFNPYAKQSTQDGVTREPFVFQQGITGTDEGKILRIEGDGANETQMTSVSRTTLPDGNRGISATLRCLTGLKLSYL